MPGRALIESISLDSINLHEFGNRRDVNLQYSIEASVPIIHLVITDCPFSVDKVSSIFQGLGECHSKRVSVCYGKRVSQHINIF